MAKFIKNLDLGHSKQKFLQKIGNSEKSVDEEFATLKAHYKATVKLLESIDHELKKQVKTESFHLPLASLGESIGRYFEDDPQEAHHGTEFRAAVNNVNAAMTEYTEYQRQISALVQDYLAKLNAIKPKLKERDNLQLDYDKWRTTFKTYQDKPPKEAEKMQHAEKKYENYKELYETTNNSLLHDLNEIYDNRYDDFDSVYSLLITSQFKLFTRITFAFQGAKDGEDSPTAMFLSPQVKTAAKTSPQTTTNAAAVSAPPPVNRATQNQGPATQITGAATSAAPPAVNRATQNQGAAEPQRKLPEPAPSRMSVLIPKAKKAKALYDYEAQESNELSFKENDIITIVEEYADSQWWKGELNSAVGLFPSNFVEVIKGPDNSEAQKRMEEAKRIQEEMMIKKQKDEAERKQREEMEQKKKEEEKRQREAEEVRRREEEKKRQEQAAAAATQKALPKPNAGPSAVLKAKALFDYNAQEDNELSFKENDVITIVEKVANSDWWQGELNGKRGLFPSNFVEILKTLPTPAPQKVALPPKPAAAAVTRPRMKAVFDFDAQEDNELPFKEGDIVTVVEKIPDSDWWKGECNGKTGLFPTNYCEPM
eukprot:TRINITY_DN2265_c0_g1_i2.p1 TRINITY_DN2265_c0_g1~~TRINITY_DN2265_c0_g1_i2.p1  ORF type:complete len:597 (-),score=210.06 TRINITY_DN2265_c0_g1_i2:52-1842(-)